VVDDFQVPPDTDGLFLKRETEIETEFDRARRASVSREESDATRGCCDASFGNRQKAMVKNILVWSLVVNFHPVDHPRDMGFYATRAECESAGKALQRNWDVIQEKSGSATDVRGPVFVHGHALGYDCVKQDLFSDRGTEPPSGLAGR
jgi:hypothetical protein